MRGLQRLASARTITAGQAFIQNLRRGHYAITADLPAHDRVRIAFNEVAMTSNQKRIADKSGSGTLGLHQQCRSGSPANGRCDPKPPPALNTAAVRPMTTAR
jgi:hypothetical protein